MFIVTLMTRVKVIFSLTVLAVVAGLGYIYVIDRGAPVQTNGHREEDVILSVTFSPARLGQDHTAKIDVLIDGEKLNVGWDQARVSPWIRPIKVPKGQQVDLIATVHAVNWVDCRIDTTYQVGVPVHLNGGGTIKCSHKVSFG